MHKALVLTKLPDEYRALIETAGLPDLEVWSRRMSPTVWPVLLTATS